MKIKKTVTLNKKKAIIPFIKSYFEARTRKKKTFHCNYMFYSFLVLNYVGNTCPFVEKKKKRKKRCV